MNKLKSLNKTPNHIVLIASKREQFLARETFPNVTIVVKNQLQFDDALYIIKSSPYYKKHTIFIVFLGLETIFKWVKNSDCHRNGCTNPYHIFQGFSQKRSLKDRAILFKETFCKGNAIDKLILCEIISVHKNASFTSKKNPFCGHIPDICNFGESIEEIECFNEWVREASDSNNYHMFPRLREYPLNLNFHNIKNLNMKNFPINSLPTMLQTRRKTQVKNLIAYIQKSIPKNNNKSDSSEDFLQDKFEKIIIITNIAYQQCLKYFHSPKLTVLTEDYLNFENLTSIAARHSHLAKGKRTLWIVVSGIFMITNTFSNPMCSFCAQPLHLVYPNLIFSSPEVILTQASNKRNELESLLGSNCSVTFVPLIPSQIMSYSLDHDFMHSLHCVNSSVVCVEEHGIDNLTQIYNNLCNRWIDFCSWIFRQLGISNKSLMKYSSLLRENYVEQYGQHNQNHICDPLNIWNDFMHIFIKQVMALQMIIPCPLIIAKEPKNNFSSSQNKTYVDIDAPSECSDIIEKDYHNKKFNHIIFIGPKMLWKAVESIFVSRATFIDENLCSLDLRKVQNISKSLSCCPENSLIFILCDVTLITNEAGKGVDKISQKSLVLRDPEQLGIKRLTKLVTSSILNMKTTLSLLRKSIPKNSTIIVSPVCSSEGLWVNPDIRKTEILNKVSRTKPNALFLHGLFEDWTKALALLSNKWKKFMVDVLVEGNFYPFIFDEYTSQQKVITHVYYSPKQLLMSNKNYGKNWMQFIKKICIKILTADDSTQGDVPCSSTSSFENDILNESFEDSMEDLRHAIGIAKLERKIRSSKCNLEGAKNIKKGFTVTVKMERSPCKVKTESFNQSQDTSPLSTVKFAKNINILSKNLDIKKESNEDSMEDLRNAIGKAKLVRKIRCSECNLEGAENIKKDFTVTVKMEQSPCKVKMESFNQSQDTSPLSIDQFAKNINILSKNLDIKKENNVQYTIDNKSVDLNDLNQNSLKYLKSVTADKTNFGKTISPKSVDEIPKSSYVNCHKIKVTGLLCKGTFNVTDVFIHIRSKFNSDCRIASLIKSVSLKKLFELHFFALMKKNSRLFENIILDYKQFETFSYKKLSITESLNWQFLDKICTILQNKNAVKLKKIKEKGVPEKSLPSLILRCKRDELFPSQTVEGRCSEIKDILKCRKSNNTVDSGNSLKRKQSIEEVKSILNLVEECRGQHNSKKLKVHDKNNNGNKVVNITSELYSVNQELFSPIQRGTTGHEEAVAEVSSQLTPLAEKLLNDRIIDGAHVIDQSTFSINSPCIILDESATCLSSGEFVVFVDSPEANIDIVDLSSEEVFDGVDSNSDKILHIVDISSEKIKNIVHSSPEKAVGFSEDSSSEKTVNVLDLSVEKDVVLMDSYTDVSVNGSSKVPLKSNNIRRNSESEFRVKLIYDSLLSQKFIKELSIICSYKEEPLKDGDGYLIKMADEVSTSIFIKVLNGKRIYDSRLSAEIVKGAVNPQKTQGSVNEFEKALIRLLDAHTRSLVDILHIKFLQDFDIWTHKTLKCAKKFCSKKELCPQFHSEEDRRRNLREANIQYFAQMCKNKNGKDAKCPLGDKCTSSHNSIEKIFHPLVFKKEICSSGLAPNKHNYKMCSSVHPGFPDSFYHAGWKNVFVQEIGRSLHYLVGSIRMMYQRDLRGSLAGLFLSPSVDFVEFALKVVSPIAEVNQVRLLMVKDGERILAHQKASAQILLGTPNSLFNFVRDCSSDYFKSFKVLIVDDVSTILNCPTQYTKLVGLFDDVRSKRFSLDPLNIIVTSDLVEYKDVKSCMKIFKTRFTELRRTNKGVTRKLDSETSDKNCSLETSSPKTKRILLDPSLEKQTTATILKEKSNRISYTNQKRLTNELQKKSKISSDVQQTTPRVTENDQQTLPKKLPDVYVNTQERLPDVYSNTRERLPDVYVNTQERRSDVYVNMKEKLPGVYASTRELLPTNARNNFCPGYGIERIKPYEAVVKKKIFPDDNTMLRSYRRLVGFDESEAHANPEREKKYLIFAYKYIQFYGKDCNPEHFKSLWKEFWQAHVEESINSERSQMSNSITNKRIGENSEFGYETRIPSVSCHLPQNINEKYVNDKEIKDLKDSTRKSDLNSYVVTNYKRIFEEKSSKDVCVSSNVSAKQNSKLYTSEERVTSPPTKKSSSREARANEEAQPRNCNIVSENATKEKNNPSEMEIILLSLMERLSEFPLLLKSFMSLISSFNKSISVEENVAKIFDIEDNKLLLQIISDKFEHLLGACRNKLRRRTYLKAVQECKIILRFIAQK